MRPHCVQAVTAAIGRQLTQAELRGIEDRVRAALPAARKNLMAAGTALSPATMTAEAGRLAAVGIVADAQRIKRNAALAVSASARIQQAMDTHPAGKMRGLMAMLVRDVADQGSTLSAEARQMAVKNLALSQLVESLETMAPKFFGLIDDSEGGRDIVRELFGERTGNVDAKAAADAWVKVADGLRERFNDAGGNVSKLGNWRMPQSHSATKVAAATEAGWVADVLPKLDRGKYVNEDGTLYTIQQLTGYLQEAYRTIATGGLNVLQPGQAFTPPSRAVANRHAEHRALHFKDSASFLAYEERFGERGIWDTWLSHISTMARDIGLVETLGPNPGHQVAHWRDVAKAAGEKESAGLPLENVYNELSGVTSHAENETLARWAQGARNLQVASKLGAAVISSITDEATIAITAKLNGLSEVQVLRNELAALNPLSSTERDLARRAGLSLETLLHEMHRFGEDRLGAGWTDKLSNATMRASGLNALTEARKRAFGVTMMSAIGKLSRKDWKSVDPSDLRLLESKGVTADDWAVWKLAKPEDWGNGNRTMLTPQAIMAIPDSALQGAGLTIIDPQRVRLEAATKLLGAILEETDMAVITPGARERAIVRQGTKSGTWTGELMRSIFLFKSFPVAMIARHWMRGVNMPTAGGKAAYLASLAVGTTILGALAFQFRSVASGKDPADMTEPSFWLRATLQGGGMGVFGDFVLADQSRFGHTITETAAGPMLGMVADLSSLTLGNIHQAARGQATHAGAEAVRFVKGNLPLVNLWYTRAALDHAVFHQVQEYLSPGYLDRMRQRVADDTGQEFWWQPGELVPERAPAF